MIERKTLETFKGKSLKIIEWYFYNESEKGEIDEIRRTFDISEKYEIVGRCTLLGDIVVFYKDKIGVISHDEPKSGPLTMVKDILEFSAFISLLEELPDYSEEDNIERLKIIRKQLKSLRKQAPKNLKDDFIDEITDIEDIIEDLKEDS